MRDRENERDTIVSRAGSNSTNSSVSSSDGGVATNGKKRGAESLESKAKRQRLSEEVVHKAENFKKFRDVRLENGERIILKSSDGTLYALTVNNAGVLSTVAV